VTRSWVERTAADGHDRRRRFKLSCSVPFGNAWAPPATANAVMDALAHLVVRHIDIPITPENVWRRLREKGCGVGLACRKIVNFGWFSPFRCTSCDSHI
jgi:hypothetical protein